MRLLLTKKNKTINAICNIIIIQSGKVDENFEFHEWLGLMKLLLRRKEEYLKLLNKPSHLIHSEKPIENVNMLLSS